MTDDHDPSDEPLAPEVRAWFASQATPTAPPSLHAFLEGMAAEAGRATPVRRVALGPRMTASSRFLAGAAALAVILVAGGLLLVSGQRGPVGPSSSPPPLASPSPSATVSQSPSASASAQASAAPPSAPASSPSTAAAPKVVCDHSAPSSAGTDQFGSPIPVTLTCENAVAAAKAVVGPDPAIASIEFDYFRWCPPGYFCVVSTFNDGHVIFHMKGQPDILVTVVADKAATVTASSPQPMPSPSA